MIDIAIIGGGAAGFMAAISAKMQNPKASVTIYEKTRKTLSKVKISGGGRCNITHNAQSIKELCAAYPRGGSFLKKVFYEFGPSQTLSFFNNMGVSTYVQDDNRVFPQTNDSQTVIDAMRAQCKFYQIGIIQLADFEQFELTDNGAILYFKDGPSVEVCKLILALGGLSKIEHYQFLTKHDIQVVSPVPSLFSFNVPNPQLQQLAGLSMPLAAVKIQGQKEWQTGAILITHWGLSGPAVLKSSSVYATVLHQFNYQFQFRVNWLNLPEQQVRSLWQSWQTIHAKKQVKTANPFGIPSRLWEFILHNSGIAGTKLNDDIGSNWLNKLMENLVQMPFDANAKTTFKEEFVTAGGIDLTQINSNLQFKNFPQLYAIGELLNIDGITGGFNFQAAWSTGYLAGKHAASTL